MFNDTNIIGADQSVSPPDDNLAVSSSQVAEVVNSSLWIYDRTGTSTGHVDLATLVPNLSYSVTDPRILFDALAAGGGRWYLSYTMINIGVGSLVILGASKTSTISAVSGTWNLFTVVTETSGIIADQPKLGYSSDKIVLSWNDFQPAPPAPCSPPTSSCFIGEETWVLQRADVDTNTMPLHTFCLVLSGSCRDANRFGLAPAQVLSTGTDAWVVYNNEGVGVAPPNNVGVPSLGTIRITGTPLAVNVIATESDPAIAATSFPPPASQPGTQEVIDTGDDRLLGAVWRNGMLWTTANTGCATGFACVRFMEAAAAGLTAATLVPGQDWDLGQPGADFYYGAASFDANGDMFASMTESTPSSFPSVAALGEAANAPGAMNFLTTVQSGAAIYFDPTAPDGPCRSSSVPSPCRWGDYGGAALDPADPTGVWIVGEYTPTTSTNNWGTHIAHITIPAVALGPGFSGDSKSDLGAVNNSSSWVMTSTGTAFSAPAPWSGVAFYGGVATLAGDVSGDGKTDLVALNSGSIWVMPSTGTGFSPPQLWSSTPFFGTQKTLLADVNGDGKTDVVAINKGSTWVLLSTGTGFSSPQLWSTSAFAGNVALLAGDLTGDGRADLVAVNSNSTWVMASTGTGFSAPVPWSGGAFFGNRATLLADVNGDGKADLVAVNSGSAWVMLSTASGFASPAPWSGTAFFGSVATLIGDVTGDGKADLVAVNSGSTWVETSNGAGFSAPVPWSSSPFYGGRATLIGS